MTVTQPPSRFVRVVLLVLESRVQFEDKNEGEDVDE
jgi:hypothetical protein